VNGIGEIVSPAAGEFAAVGCGVALGRSKRPLRCDALGEADADAIGTGVADGVEAGVEVSLLSAVALAPASTFCQKTKATTAITAETAKTFFTAMS
jgi:hypothetical protein